MSEPRPPESSTTDAVVGCDCIKKSRRPDGLIAQSNTKIDVNWLTNRQTGAVVETVMIATSLLTKKRGARPIHVVPNYCPMCGTRYVPAAASPREVAE